MSDFAFGSTGWRSARVLGDPAHKEDGKREMLYNLRCYVKHPTEFMTHETVQFRCGATGVLGPSAIAGGLVR